MNSGQSGWMILLFFAIILVVIGVQGSLGLATAIIFVPSKVEIQE